jgi:hypothetical protein
MIARALEQSLASYAVDPPYGLSLPGGNGIRIEGVAMYVDLEGGKVASVAYDPVLGAYCARSPKDSQPSGPALYRPEGEMYWRENTFATRLRPYQLSSEHRASFDRRSEALISTDIRSSEATLRPLYSAQLTKLSNDAEVFYGAVTPPPRPLIPLLAGVATLPRLVETVLAASQGVILTENYVSTSSKMQLMDNMSALAASGVTTLYLDRLRIDIDQIALDHLFRTGEVSNSLGQRLKHLDVNVDAAYPTPYTYEGLIIAAQENGIRVRGLDCAARYRQALLGGEYHGHSTYHANQVIMADRLSHPGGKWIALIDAPLERQLNSPAYERQHVGWGVNIRSNRPDLAQLQGVLSIRIEDIPGGPAIRITQESPLSTAELSLEVGGQGLRPYELSRRYRNDFETIIRRPQLPADPFGIHQQVHFAENLDRRRARREHSRREWDIVDASQRFFDRHPLPPRPPAPTLPPYSPVSDIVESVYRQSNGLVLGAAYNAIGARMLLIDNLPALARQQVKTLYLQNLVTEYDQPLLTSFASSGVMSEKLRANLRRQDELQGVDPLSTHALENLVTIARQHGIRVRALDTSASYQDDLRVYFPLRPNRFKFIAHTIIEGVQVQQGAHKWVALVGSEHANTVRNVPGLAELEGVIGIRVVDVGGQPDRVMPDAGEIISNRLPILQQAATTHLVPPSHQFVKSDLLLEVNVSTQAIQRPIANPGNLLHRPKEFLIERSAGGFVLYVRLDGTEAKRIPVQMDNDKFFIRAPFSSLEMVHAVRFNSLDRLVWALQSSGMKQVPGTTAIPASPHRLVDQFPLLTRPGQYIVSYRPQGIELYHRSKDGEVKRTKVNEIEDKLYINNQSWGMSIENKFKNMAELTAHLERRFNMTLVQTFDMGVPQLPL